MMKVDLLATFTHLNYCAQEEDIPPCSGLVVEVYLLPALLLV